MKKYITTGKTLKGNYIGWPLRSCKPIDYPTEERAIINHEGQTYERTIHERAIYRNMEPNTLWCRFVIIDDQFLEVEEWSEEREMQKLGFSRTADGLYFRREFKIELTTDFYPTPTWVCYMVEDGDIVDGVAGYDTPMEAWEGMLEEIELVSNRRD